MNTMFKWEIKVKNRGVDIVEELVNESQTTRPCTRLVVSMQSGQQRNYVESVSTAGRLRTSQGKAQKHR